MNRFNTDSEGCSTLIRRSQSATSHRHCQTEEWNRSGLRTLKQRLCVAEVYSGTEYSYIVTENSNQPSIKIFTDKCGDSKFCTSSILVHPVFTNRVQLNNQVAILKLAPSDAKSLYRCRFSTTEFFPRDIDSVLNSKLNLDTFITVPHGSYSWPGSDRFLANPLKYV
ncbi:putative N-acetyltransferase HLS1-like [Camellia lanceoleosa]|uniref:N-acetyltransferase HLS1-like n=1 Tax=Camellia lanceoleosa TaxID=1840588 RepID=A0ACC0IDM3_9ERIC|nr:putative N-acetyltransferase HLS1-like [Camellia lanceoleosa]